MTRKKHPKHTAGTNVETLAHPPKILKSTEKKKKLEIVLKCDSPGSEEAILASLSAIQIPEIELEVIHADVGSVTKSDLLLALTASRLVLGFNVGVAPKIEQLCREQGVEVRLYEVIYALTNDLQSIANGLIAPAEEKEKITGKAKVIALFKSSRKGVIIGCEVLEGTLAIGKKFRIVSAMGPVYTGEIESLHIQKDAIKEAKPHQQVGIKIIGLKKATIGDLVECFEVSKSSGGTLWQPKGGVFKKS